MIKNRHERRKEAAILRKLASATRQMARRLAIKKAAREAAKKLRNARQARIVAKELRAAEERRQLDAFLDAIR